VENLNTKTFRRKPAATEITLAATAKSKKVRQLIGDLPAVPKA